MSNLLISACLLGICCRYDGDSRPLPNEVLEKLNRNFTLIPVCPEVLGGLSTPRTPSERVGESVMTADGREVTQQYKNGSKLALEMAFLAHCEAALLKEKSPSCGNGQIYDGTFSKVLKDGNGVFTELLTQNGIHIYGESQISDLLSIAGD